MNEPVSSLAAGVATTITVSTPPGDNCYDPDCTVSVVVDVGDDVPEADETNNEDSETTLG